MAVEMKCHCGEEYKAREADLKRGWARSCSKSCAAIRRDFGRPAAKRVDGGKLPHVKKKGAKRYTRDTRYDDQSTLPSWARYNPDDIWNEYDEHPFSDEGLGQWLD